jgi:carbon storage regulator
MARVVSLMEIQEQGGSMLVLSRKLDESIVVGHQVKITVIEIRGDVVRLGIEAPIEISVHRMEIETRINKERRMLE